MHRTASILSGLIVLLLTAGCHSLDDDRIPPSPVNLVFATEAQWSIYGVTGAMDYRSFVRDLRIPGNFPYTASSYTGFGGILLVCDVLGQPRAYDLACPVEQRQDVRVQIDAESMNARCSKCGSTYDVFSLPGHPLSGPAAQHGYGLRPYHVGPGKLDFMTVSF